MSITDMIVNKFTHTSDEDTAKHGTDYDPAENMDAVYSPPVLPPLPAIQPPLQFSIAAAFTPPVLPADRYPSAVDLPPRPNAADVIAASLVGTAQEAPSVAKLNASSEYGKMNNPPSGLPSADHLACFLTEYAAMKDELASLRQQVAGLMKTLAAEQFAHAQTKETLASEEANHENTKDALTTVHEAHQSEMAAHQNTAEVLADEQNDHAETKATLCDMTTENTRMRVRLDWIMKLCDLNPDGATNQPLSPDDEAELSKVIAGLTRINK